MEAESARPLSCNLCGSWRLSTMIDFGRFPVGKHYLSSMFEARQLYPMKLAFCEYCGLSQLVDPCPPDILYLNYINFSSYKPQPQAAQEIDAIESFLPKDARIIEIGSNDGYFLDELRKRGYRNSLGIEPAVDACAIARRKGIHTLQAFLTSELCDFLGKFDLVVSRQNLEHIPALLEMAICVRKLLKPDAHALFEVPDWDANLAHSDYAIWEEHVNYFTVDTLRSFFNAAGMQMLNSNFVQFSGGSFFAIGKQKEEGVYVTDYREDLRRKNLAYAGNWPSFKRRFTEALDARRGKRVAVYGAASRIFCLLNFLDVLPRIDVMIDDQPEKQGKFVPGSGLKIEGADALRKADICLLAVNIENEAKVMERHKEWRGEWHSILPPSERLFPAWQ